MGCSQNPPSAGFGVAVRHSSLDGGPDFFSGINAPPRPVLGAGLFYSADNLRRYAQPSDVFWRLIWTLGFLVRAIQ
jgi:hypothetical protein